MLFPGIDPEYARMIYVTMLQSTLDYGSHLSRLDETARTAISNVKRRFFAAALGLPVRETQLPVMRLLFRLDSRSLRNKLLAKKFVDRMTKMEQNAAKPAAAAQAAATMQAISSDDVIQGYLKHRNRKAQQLRDTAFRETAARMRRPVPWRKRIDLPPALTLKHHDLRRLAVRWHLGSFPICAHVLKRVGSDSMLQELRLLSKPVLTDEEWRRLNIALHAVKNADSIGFAFDTYARAGRNF